MTIHIICFMDYCHDNICDGDSLNNLGETRNRNTPNKYCLAVQTKGRVYVDRSLLQFICINTVRDKSTWLLFCDHNCRHQKENAVSCGLDIIKCRKSSGYCLFWIIYVRLCAAQNLDKITFYSFLNELLPVMLILRTPNTVVILIYWLNCRWKQNRVRDIFENLMCQKKSENIYQKSAYDRAGWHIYIHIIQNSI